MSRVGWIVVLMSACGLVGASQAANQPALVFLLAGQSQIAGHAKGELPGEYRGQPSNLLFFETGEFRKLGPRDYDSGAVLRKGDKGIGRFGPEISFGHEIARAFPDRTIILVKQAGAGGLGHPSRGWNPQLTGQGVDQLLTAYRTATKDRSVELAAILWSQGSGDSSNEAMAKAYAANLRLLIDRLRKDLGAAELPFFYGQYPSEDAVPKEVLQGQPYYKLLTAAYAEVAGRLPAMVPVSRVGLSTLGEGDSHYDVAGALEFGRRYAAAYLKWATTKSSGPDAQKK